MLKKSKMDMTPLNATDIDCTSDEVIEENATDITDCTSDQEMEQCSSSQTKDFHSLIYKETQSELNRVVNDSYSENHKQMYCPNNKHDLVKSGNLLKQLGFSVAEYTSKMNDVKTLLLDQLGFSEEEYTSKVNEIKKLFAALNNIFMPEGTNGQTLGDWEKSIKSDEAQLLCLLYIRESILKFQNNDPDPKDNAFTNKLCDCQCDNNVTLNQLKKENDDLVFKLSESNEGEDESSQSSSKHNKDGSKKKKSELTMKLKTTKQLHKTAISKDMDQDIETLKVELNNMIKKVKSAEEYCKKIEEEKRNSHEQHIERVKVLQERNLKLINLKQDLESKLYWERQKKIECNSTIAHLEIHVKKLTHENKELEKNFHDELMKKKKLISNIEDIAKVAANLKYDVEEDFGIMEATSLTKEFSEVEESHTSQTESTANEFSNSVKEVGKDLRAYSADLFRRSSISMRKQLREKQLKEMKGSLQFKKMEPSDGFKIKKINPNDFFTHAREKKRKASEDNK